MIIWIDADSCPLKVRSVLCRAAERVKIVAKFVANRNIPIDENDFTEMIVVEDGEGVADDYIVEHSEANSLCITRDIPLAFRLVESGVSVMNDRGDHFTQDNIRQRLALRDLMTEMRLSGLETEKHPAFSNKQLQKFSSLFDRELTRLMRLE